MPRVKHPDFPTAGDLIRMRRRSAGLTEEQLADLMEVDQSTISHWENDVTMPTFAHLRKLAKLLGCTLDQLSGAMS